MAKFPQSVKTHRAQIPHECSRCGGRISPGRKYIRVVRVNQGEPPEVVKLHLGEDCERPNPPKRYGKQ